MGRVELAVATADGACPLHLVTPSDDAGAGPWPAVLLYMDGIGIRPALFDLAAGIAAGGYVVALPDLFYRSGPYAPINPDGLFSDPDRRAAHIARFMAKLGAANAMRDTAAILDALAARPEVRAGAIAVTGYCMGGGLALHAAGTFPERIAAAASFHGGNLATDAPDSPHLVAPRIRGRVYVGSAAEDPSFPDAQRDRLIAAFESAGVGYALEPYAARHGWVPRDTPAHDPPAAARHDAALRAFLAAAL